MEKVGVVMPSRRVRSRRRLLIHAILMPLKRLPVTRRPSAHLYACFRPTPFSHASSVHYRPARPHGARPWSRKSMPRCGKCVVKGVGVFFTYVCSMSAHALTPRPCPRAAPPQSRLPHQESTTPGCSCSHATMSQPQIHAMHMRDSSEARFI